MISKPIGYYLLATIFLLSAGLIGLSEIVHAEVRPETIQTEPFDRINWQKVTSAEEVWQAYPGRIRSLLAALDLDRPGLKRVRDAVQDGDTVAASKALLAHYRESASGHWLLKESNGNPGEEVLTEARQLLKDKVTFSGVTATVPHTEDGGWKWQYTGPENDQEFGYSLNAHYYLASLLEAWEQTKNKDYAKTFDRLIRDWIIHNPLPGKEDSIYVVLDTPDDQLDWRDIEEVIWRDLEAGRRLGASWPQTFYGFQRSEAFTPAARLLMLASISEQAKYLREYHKEGHNWTTMEMNGLALAGLAFPEFKKVEDWATYALNVMKKEINHQVYSDGVQTELSTKTQWVALRRFESVADNFRKAGRTIPSSYTRRLEEMYNYLAYSMRPDGHQPLNNDSDREDLRPRVLKAAQIYDRPDWKWIATNGREGLRPEGLPSVVFPWAGINVMRNGWDGQAHWAFFDTGPFGTGHQHADKLHLSITAYGRDLLVDGGRYTHENYWSFDPEIWRGYFRSSFSHNIILVDGRGQNGGPTTVDEPLQEGVDYMNTSDFDYARGTFNSGYNGVEGSAEHTRAVLYVRDRFWVVVDRVQTDRPRKIQALWHYAPDCVVQTEQQQVVSTNSGKGNLRIVPAGKVPWQVEIVKGQETPFIQGWYSSEYGIKEPNATAVYTTEIEKSTVFAWLMMPAKGTVPQVDAELTVRDEEGVYVRIKESGREPVTVTVPLDSGKPTVTN